MFENFLGYLVGGAVIGILARLIKPGADPMGWILTILLGIAGAVVGSELAADGRREVRYRDVRRCEVRHEQRSERRVVAYRVPYEHRGRRGVARMAHDPGRYVAIADVRRRG